MKKRIVNWFKGHRVLRAVLPSVLALLLISAAVVPYAEAAITYLDVEGTYIVTTPIKVYYQDGTSHPNQLGSTNTLTITTQTNQAISSASLTMFGETLALTGLVGSGSRPWISLTGNDGNDTYVAINARIASSGGVVTSIRGGTITGYIISDGWKGTDTNGTSATSTVDKHGGTYSALLTAGSGTGSVYVRVRNPINRIYLRDLDTLVAGIRGISAYFNLQTATTPGPQIELRFTADTCTNPDGTGHVDVTVMPYQAPYTGDGTWKQCVLTSESGRAIYYGNDPTDGTAFSWEEEAGNYTLADVEALINAETAMGTDSASNWRLTRIAVELWEGGARTCYVDDVQIGSYTYTLEPAIISGGFNARVSD